MPESLVLAVIFFLLLPLLLLLLTRKRVPHGLPPSPPKLPLIGNLHQLSPLVHHSFASLAKVHGPLMLVHLGRVPTYVISSAELAGEALRVRDPVFASRPSMKMSTIVFYGPKDIIFTPYTAYWRWARKIFSIHLLSSKRVRSYESVREEEVIRMVEAVKADQSVNDIVDVTKILYTYTIDLICRIVSGKLTRNERRNKEFNEAISELATVLQLSSLEESLPPWMAWLGEFLGLTRTAKRVDENHRKWDALLEELLEEQRKTKGEALDDDEGEGLADVLLRLKENGVEGDEGFVLGHDNVKALLVDTFAAATHTTYTTLEWAMAEIARNSEVKGKLQDELRREAGKLGHDIGILRTTELNSANLPYLNAVIKETLRLHPSVPLLVPKETIEDCTLGGYEIPKGARVMINAWGIARDPECWDAPEKFNPDRFIDSDVDFKGNHFYLIPFGAGRRMCPGMLFASTTMEIVIANLMYCFDWELPRGMDGDAMDMTEEPGMGVRRKEKLELIARCVI